MKIALAVILAAFALTSHAPMQAQTVADQTVTLGEAYGRATGTLRLPATPARPPIVCLMVSSTAENDGAALATALASEGVASLRIDANTAETVAPWITLLRNDERFPTVTMFSEGAPTLAAVTAARAARADGVVTRGETTAATAELARLVAKAGTATDASGIAAFARTVPVLGRRGTSATRPTTARRSPRQLAMATVGSVRVSIEWGAPQMRGREVWGGLVKWNQIWMPGADEATTITTNGPLTIGTLDLPAGDYTLFTFPTADRVQLIVSGDVGQFHTVHDESKFMGRMDMAQSERTDSVEGLTFAIESPDGAATLKLMWATREYSVPLTTK